MNSASAARTDRPRFDRSLWAALLIAAIVISLRSVLVVQAHSDTYDEASHVVLGLRYWSRDLQDTYLNDPPLGDGIIALPLWLMGCRAPESNPKIGYFDQPLSPEEIQLIIAIWKSILFLPMVGVVFVWCRRLYSVKSAWLALGLLLVEPNFAAHIPVATPDVLVVEAVVIACFLAWQYFERPTTGRLVGLALAISVALMIKHNAVVLPLVVCGYAVLWWIIRRSPDDWRAQLPQRLKAASLCAVVAIAFIWPLTLFDISRPMIPVTYDDSVLTRTLRQVSYTPLPAGVYIRAFATGARHGVEGHEGYLWGQRSITGWWYYFPVLMTYKVPLGIWLVIILGWLSLIKRRFAWNDCAIAVPLVIFMLFMMNARINIGIRHFLPAYIFVLLFAVRCVASGGRGWIAAAWIGVAASAAHGLMYHPDYISYINFSRDRVYLGISDSNIDWGQSLKQVRRWIDTKAPSNQPIYLKYFGVDALPRVEHYLPDRVILIGRAQQPPTSGILIISPVWVAGMYEEPETYAFLRDEKPVEVIGHSMLVFDLDAIAEARK